MIERAIKLAGRSSHQRHRTGAVIAHKDKILAEGWSHVSSLRLKELYSIHAEIHCLAKARHLDLENATCYVATLTRVDHLTMGKPCLTCAVALRAAGIKTVYFTAPYSQQGNTPLVLNLDLAANLDDLKQYPKEWW